MQGFVSKTPLHVWSAAVQATPPALPLVAGQRAAGDALVLQPVFGTCLAAILSVCLSHGAICRLAIVWELQFLKQSLHSKVEHCPNCLGLDALPAAAVL